MGVVHRCVETVPWDVTQAYGEIHINGTQRWPVRTLG